MSAPAGLDELVPALLAEHDVPGCSVGATWPGGRWTGAYGLARTEPRTTFRPDTRVPVASMTKPFTATALMAMAEAGRLDIDAPVRRYLPEFRVADAGASERVSVRHLLTHRAGWLGDEPDLVTDRGDGALAAQIARFADLPQLLAPNTTFSYANTGFTVAGRLVEVLAGQSYEAVVERSILAPLGLRASTFFAEHVVTHPAASGHVDGRPSQECWLLPRPANPSGGLVSTADDVLTWLAWWLGGDDGPVRRGTRERMLTELVPVGAPPASTGLGWHVDHVDGTDVVYHEGSLQGTATVCRFVPAAGVGVVVLTNADDGEHVYHAVVDHLLAELAGVRTPAVTVADAPPDELAAYAGSYAIAAPGRTEHVQAAVDGGRMRLRVEVAYAGRAIDLTVARQHGDLFAVVGPPWPDLPAEFLRNAGGELYGLRLHGRVFLARPSPDRRS